MPPCNEAIFTGSSYTDTCLPYLLVSHLEHLILVAEGLQRLGQRDIVLCKHRNLLPALILGGPA